MTERPGPRSARPRRTTTRRTNRQTQASAAPKSAASVRDRLRRDPLLFIACLAGLAFLTWACAMTWWLTGATASLALALVSVAPAFYLFYLRDA
jgi:hypothetical protein